ncbi:MAG: Gfo/Idh/MocA family oxidoreductase [Breznakibacter sp.]
MKNINWGIIGCGDVTELKSGPAFNKIEGSCLKAVMRRNAEKAKDYALRHQVPLWFSNADELIIHPEVNAIYVATPPDSHAEYAIKAMRAGKPVYVEKPMGANLEQCLRMLEVSKSTDIPLFVAYYRRTLPGYLKVKELIDNGVIGKPIAVKIELIRPVLDSERQGGNGWWRVDPKLSGGGIFVDLASHQFDFLDFLFGPIKQSHGFCRNVGGMYSAEDTVVATFEHDNGVIGAGSWCFVSNPVSQRDVMEIHGTEGRIVFTGFGHSPIQLHTASGFVEFPYINPENIQYNLIKQVVETLQGRGACVSTGNSAIRTNMVIANILSDFYK